MRYATVWRVTTEPSLFPSGCWAHADLWGARRYFATKRRAFSFAAKYVFRHPFGQATVEFNRRAALKKAGVE